MQEQDIRWEPLGGGIQIGVSAHHAFGADGIMLAHFAAVHLGRGLCCDLGSGCGIVPLYWHTGLFPAPQTCYAVEIQPQAVDLLATTVARNKLDGRIIPLALDLRNGKDLPEPGGFALVTCNPPYKVAGSGVPSPEDARLTARHEVSCTIQDVCGAAARLLRPGGCLCLCQRPHRLADTLEAMRAHRIEPKRIRFVQQRANTAPWLFLVEGRRNGGRFLQVEAPLIVEENGGYSTEMLAIYGKEANK